MDPRTYSERDIASFLSLSVAQVRRWRWAGIGPPAKKLMPHRAGTVRYPADAYRKWLSSARYPMLYDGPAKSPLIVNTKAPEHAATASVDPPKPIRGKFPPRMSRSAVKAYVKLQVWGDELKTPYHKR